MENQNSGYAVFQLGGNTEFDWFSASISTELVILPPPLPSMTSKTGMAGRPKPLLSVLSLQGLEELAFDI
jgi:hypothetical protein